MADDDQQLPDQEITIKCPCCRIPMMTIPKSMMERCYGFLCPDCDRLILTPYIFKKKPRKSYTKNAYGEDIYKSMKKRAELAGIAVNITYEEFHSFWQTEDVCYYCGITMPDYTQLMLSLKTEGIRIASYAKRLTIDRRDNSKGYEVGNIVKACWLCNNIKGAWMTEEEAKRFCPEIINRLLQEMRLHPVENIQNILDQWTPPAV